MKFKDICLIFIGLALLLCSQFAWGQNASINQRDKSGLPTGKWIFFLDNELKPIADSVNYVYYKTVNFTDGVPKGFVNYYYKSGKLYFQTTVVSLNPDMYSDGKITFYSESGEKIKELTYAQGNLNGWAVYYFPDGKIRMEGNYLENKKSGIWKQWNEDGSYSLGNYDNDIPEGGWTYYSAKGELQAEGKLHNGKRTGKWFLYGEGGEREEGSYLSGKREGNWLGFYSDGTPYFQGSYKQDEREGLWKEWSPAGELSQGNYAQNLRTGLWTFYDPKGKKISEGNYLNGKKDGQWLHYNSAGQIVKTETYKDGILIP